jgi:hypothetical protein
VVSRLTGLFRTLVLAGVLGVSAVADAYNGANSFPNMVYELLLGGVLSSVFVPLLVRAHLRGPTYSLLFTQRLLAVVHRGARGRDDGRRDGGPAAGPAGRRRRHPAPSDHHVGLPVAAGNLLAPRSHTEHTDRPRSSTSTVEAVLPAGGSLPHQVHQWPTAIVDGLVMALEAKFVQHPQ